jgi:NAD(P)-dependent dehydrogenase (short-subunit alcohol dehydrogenase family)
MNADKGLRVFKGATAIITGGASGIGKAIAIELSRRGCEVVLADVQYELAQEVVSYIQSTGGKASAKKVDVRNFNTVKELVEETVQRTGRLDYMFNNAGSAIIGAVSNYSIDDWNLIIDINLRGEINGIQAAYPVMLKQKFGQIVNTSSMAGLIPSPGNAVYLTTKHAIIGLSLSLRMEAALHGIRINAVCPGAVRTPMMEGKGEFNKSVAKISSEKLDLILHEIFKKMRPMNADLFAKKVLRLVAKDKSIIIVPSPNKIIIFLYKLFPETILNLSRIALKKYNKVFLE